MTETTTAISCTTCGMRGDADPEFHAERYGHWPTVQCGEQITVTIANPITHEQHTTAVCKMDKPFGDDEHDGPHAGRIHMRQVVVWSEKHHHVEDAGRTLAESLILEALKGDPRSAAEVADVVHVGVDYAQQVLAGMVAELEVAEFGGAFYLTEHGRRQVTQ